MTETNPADRPDPAKADGRYFVAVGVLLVIIIAALAALWLMERSRRQEAQQRLADVARAQSFGPMQALMAPRPPTLHGAGGAVEPIRREDQYTRPVTLDGAKTVGVFISAEAGQRLGFAPGDVVVVARAAATRPAGP